MPPVMSPDLAMSKAKELVAQGHHTVAIKKLRECFAKPKINPWNEKHEKAMIDLMKIEISIKANLREDLNLYRLFTREAGKETFAKVLSETLDEAEKKTTEVEKVEDVETVDQEGSPESMLLKAVSGEEMKDRLAREAATPWLKYISDCYKTCMDVCSKSLDHEDTFHKVAVRAFSFCRKHNQKLAFRTTFSRMLRENWQSMNTLLSNQIAAQPDIITKRKKAVKEEIGSGEKDGKFNLMIRAELELLDVAVHFDNWQEAYKTIEDIHTRITHFVITPKNEIMVTYYTQLAQVFWASQNHLFHAYTLQRLLSKTRDHKKQPDKKLLQTLANKCVIAVLCIPFWTQEKASCLTPFTHDPQREKAQKMTTLLGTVRPPTRESLLADLHSQKILQAASPEVVNLYNIMERNVQPLSLGQKVSPIFEWLAEAGLQDYVAHLKLVSAVSVIVGCSKVFATLSLKSLSQMCKFYENFDLESLLVTVARSPAAHVGICIDHQTGSVKFEDANISSDILTSTLPDIRSRLAVTNRMLLKRGEEGKALMQHLGDRENLLVRRVHGGYEAEREKIQTRTRLIEKKKVKDEEEEEEKRKEQVALAEEAKKRKLTAERARIAEEAAKRDKEALDARTKEFNRQQTEVVVRALEQTDIKIKTNAITKRLKNEEMDTQDVLEEGKKLMLEAKVKEEQKRMKEWHQVHWLERACREVEAPMVREAHKERLETMETAFKARKAITEKQLLKDWQEAKAHKERLAPMAEYMETFYMEVMGDRLNDGRAVARAEKVIRDQDHEKLLMQQAGRATGPPVAAPASRTKEEEKPANPSYGVDNWRAASAVSDEPPPAASSSAAPSSGLAAAKQPFRAAGGSWRQSSTPDVEQSNAADPPKEKEKEKEEQKPEKKSWGSNRKGAFKIDI